MALFPIADFPLVGDADLLSRFLKDLFVTDPQDDLASIDNERGKILRGSCQWILTQSEYSNWVKGSDMQFLKLTGSPGVGKTTITRFLVRHIQEVTSTVANSSLIYYFCDNRDEKRRAPNCLLRSLLFQILQDWPNAFQRIASNYKNRSDKGNLVDNIHTLWRYFCDLLQGLVDHDLFMVIDALDETDRESRESLIRMFAEFSESFDQSKGPKIKFLITSRPEPDVEYYLNDTWKALRIDSDKINADVSKFIIEGVDTLSSKKGYPEHLKKDVQNALSTKADGTFLWVSFVLKDLTKSRNYEVKSKLANLPSGLDEVYDRILRQIEPSQVETAIFVLQWVVVAQRPLTTTELATAYGTQKGVWESGPLPPSFQIEELMDLYQSCESLLFIDPEKQTVNLVHQSLKDYLVGEHLKSHGDIGKYAVSFSDAHMLAFESCWTYFSFNEFNEGNDIVRYDGSRLHSQQHLWAQPSGLPTPMKFLAYAGVHWLHHAPLFKETVLSNARWQREELLKLPTIRDKWFYRVVEDGDIHLIRFLLNSGANAAARDGDGSTLHIAVSRKDYDLVNLLLDEGLDIDIRDATGTTALYEAAAQGYGDIARLLLRRGAQKLSTMSRVCRYVTQPGTGDCGDSDLFSTDGRPNLELMKSLFLHECRMHENQVVFIIEKAAALLKSEPTLLRVRIPINICGAIYGQYHDMLKIFDVGGSPKEMSYLFLGNYINRGDFGVECLLYLFALKINYPDKVFLLRGNHECDLQASRFQFKLECCHKYSDIVYNKFLEIFSALPLAAVVNEQILCVNGGLGPELRTLGDIENVSLGLYKFYSKLIPAARQVSRTTTKRLNDGSTVVTALGRLW